MFDIGFLEILVILIIALIVIGPERMPEVARKIGSFVGKTRRFIDSVKQENHVQETLQDFKQSMNLEAEQEKISKIHKELQDGLNVGMENVNLDDFQRPFGGSVESSGSSFNRAPTQPQMQPTAEQSPAADNTSKTGVDAAAAKPVETTTQAVVAEPTQPASASNTQDSATKNATQSSKS